MGQELQKAKDLLFGPDGIGCTNIKIFPGSNREATTEQIAKAITESIQDVIDGNAEVVTDFDDDIN